MTPEEHREGLKRWRFRNRFVIGIFIACGLIELGAFVWRLVSHCAAWTIVAQLIGAACCFLAVYSRCRMSVHLGEMTEAQIAIDRIMEGSE